MKSTYGKDFRKKFTCFALLCSLIMTSAVGCGLRKEDASGKNVTAQDISEEAGTIGEGNGDSAEDVLSDTTETEPERVKSSIVGSGCTLESNGVSGKQGLYELEISGLDSETFITDMEACGDNLLVIAGKFNDGLMACEYTLYLISPLDMNIIGEHRLADCMDYNESIFVNDDNNIAVVDAQNGNVYFFDSGLNEYGVAETGKTDLSECFVASDFKKIYFTVQYGDEVFSYDVDEGTETRLFTKGGDVEFTYVSIVGLWSDRNIIMLSLFDGDTGESGYEAINADTGETVSSGDIAVSCFQGDGEGYVARAQMDGLEEIIYRNTESGGDMALALPDYDEYGNVCADARSNMIITDVEDDSDGDIRTISLNAYNRTTGERGNSSEFVFDISEDYVCLGSATVIDSLNIVVLDLQKDLFVWDLADEATVTLDEKCYAKSVSRSGGLTDADYAELRKIADDIGNRYCFEVYFGDDINDCSRDIYEYEPAQNVVRISQSLDMLDYALSRYPEGMFEELSKGEGGILKIYLSGQIIAADESAITTAVGVQSTGFDDTYIVLDIYSTLDYERSIYHEICHALEKYMESEGHYYDYDQWLSYNPEDFIYDYDYIANAEDADMTYIIGDYENGVYFLDIYSKSFPNEDRARIMEYAMMEEKTHTGYFENEALADKLRCISAMLREGFDDSGWPEVTDWEGVFGQQ